MPPAAWIDRNPFIAFGALLSFFVAMFFIGLFAAGGFAQSDRKFIEDPPLSKYEEKLLALDHEGLEQAYRDHIKLVFGVWMKDPNDPDAPRRAGNGARNAREGFARSMEAIERRERRLKEIRP